MHYLKEWLALKGISQRQFALDADFPQQTIQRWCSIPSAKIDTLSALRIAVALNIDVEALYQPPPGMGVRD